MQSLDFSKLVTYPRILIGGFILFIGSLIGAYVGAKNPPRPDTIPVAQQSSETLLYNHELLALDIGSEFPGFSVKAPDQSARDIHSVTEGHISVIFFWSLGCDDCHVQAEQWDYYIEPYRRRNVKTLVLLDSLHQEKKKEIQDVVKGHQLYFTDSEFLRKRLNVVLVPIAVVLDPQNRVLHIEYGNDWTFDESLVRAVTTYEID